jgi:hypothetical protein
MNQNVISAHGGPGSQPALPRGPHIPQQLPVTRPPATSNQLATQIRMMNISGPPQPSNQTSVSCIFINVFCFPIDGHFCVLCLYPVFQFPLFIDN